MMKKLIVFSMLAFSSPFFATAQSTKPKPKANPKTTVEKPVMKNLLDSFSYAAGMNIAGNMKDQGITDLNAPLMMQALMDVLNGKPTLLTHEESSMKLQEQLQAFAQKKSAGQKAKDAAFMTANKARKEVTTLANGLQYEILKAGEANGVKPGRTDTVVVDYVGTLIDGTEFDNSVKRGQPASFPLDGVIKGWTEILQLMTKGAHWKVYIPSELGYGDRGAGGSIPPGATLIFEITLLDIKPAVKQ